MDSMAETSETLPRKVLLTGSSGVLGTALSSALSDRGVDFVGFDLNTPTTPHVPEGAATRTCRGDIRDSNQVARLLTGVDTVVHCAAALPSNSSRDIVSTDVDGTRVMLEAAERAGVARFVHISSTAVYGLPHVTPTPESFPRTPIDAYNTAKIEAEQVCEQFRSQGLDVCILRPKTFLGPGRLGLFSMLFEWAAEGHNFPVIGPPGVRAQMLDVQDLVHAVLSILGSPASVFNATYNIGATRFGTLRSDFQAVLDESRFGKKVVPVPTAAAVPTLQLLAKCGISPVYDRLVHKLTADSVVDTTRAEEAFGFRPAYSNTDTLLRTYRWWLRNREAVQQLPSGTTHNSPWKQGALRLAKVAF